MPQEVKMWVIFMLRLYVLIDGYYCERSEREKIGTFTKNLQQSPLKAVKGRKYYEILGGI